MRISDWSSDVCSSDLEDHACRIWFPSALGDRQPPVAVQRVGRDAAADDLCLGDARRLGNGADRRLVLGTGDPPDGADRSAGRDSAGRGAGAGSDPGMRSEEHTSELQSLMRISYAVFCLKKKTTEQSHTR